MAVGAVGGSISMQYLAVSAPGVLTPPGQGGAQAAAPARRSQNDGQDGGFGQEVALALQQSGINLSGAAAAQSQGQSAGAAALQGSDAVGAASGAGNVQQALHTFVHAVYQAVQSEGLSSGGGSEQGQSASGYGDFQGNLQRLLQDVDHGVQNNATSGITQAFKDLQQSLGGNAVAGAATHATLHTFLQNLVTLQSTQLQNAGGVGSLIDTSA
ncbi:hypothetical protein [Chromobacterium sp. ASV23]|uniref:hypothetical protein n=1 Tax=Chromobacterium sp. ASV23 TaxID=2795110 RepID=UPI0018EAC907|nr:hypothetical protein [Chromobacterium sp. ASV23]